MPTRDLTHPLSSATPVYPGDPPIRVDPHATMAADGYRVAAARLGSHAGTHVDAPAHTEPDGATLDSFPVDRFSLAARLATVDVGPGGVVGPADLPAAGDLSADVDALVVRTGWAARWDEGRYWTDHPTLAPAAAERLAAAGLDVALDLPSPDPGAGDLPAHRVLLGADRLVLENLTNLEDLPREFRLRALPLALADADGAPVRAVAEW